MVNQYCQTCNKIVSWEESASDPACMVCGRTKSFSQWAITHQSRQAGILQWKKIAAIILPIIILLLTLMLYMIDENRFGKVVGHIMGWTVLYLVAWITALLIKYLWKKYHH